jgi:multimeric flavodoxin WrbA
MKVLAFNGSPRKKWNTGLMLEKALEGAASQGATTELVHLYDFNYKGCISCFACKLRGGKSYGKCAVQDELTQALKKVEDVDVLILGSPIYFTTVTGQMRSFMERLFFPYHTYTDPPQSLFPRKISTAFIYTMGVTEELMVKFSYEKHLSRNAMYMERIFGASESLYSFDTYQFDDYSKYVADRFDPEQKAKRRKEIFPLDCQKAFEMGVRFARGK